MNPTITLFFSIALVFVAIPWLVLRGLNPQWNYAASQFGNLLATTVVVGFCICVLIGTF